MSDDTDVLTAIEMLLEEIETVIEAVNSEGSAAFASGKHKEAEAALARVKAMTAFREKVAALRSEWATLAPETPARPTRRRGRRKKTARLRRGLRTSEAAYRQPILQALVEMGGKGETGAVLNRVRALMRDVLKQVDDQPLASDPKMPRWRNAAQWARNRMVQEGLLASDSPRGIWEITAAGRRWLAENPDR